MQTVIFDVDDTLYDQALSFHRVFRELIHPTFSYQQIDAVYHASRRHSERLFDLHVAGQITEQQWQVGRIIAACHEFDLPIDDDIAIAFHHQYLEAQGKIVLFPEAEKLLTKLNEQGMQLAILTNGEVKHQSMKIETLQLNRWIPDDHMFISGDYTFAKPSKEIFQIVENRLELTKQETVYIGDSFEKDIIGAKQVGWQAIWMNHRQRNIPPGSDVQADIEVHSPEELLLLW